MAETSSDTGQARHAHEERDINIRMIGLAALGLALLLAGSLALMGWLFNVLNFKPGGTGLQGAPLARTLPRPPEPRLQPSPARDQQELLRVENERLQSYGWVDRSAGIARIPIDQAVHLLIAQGLPSWSEAYAPTTPGREVEAGGGAGAPPGGDGHSPGPGHVE